MNKSKKLLDNKNIKDKKQHSKDKLRLKKKQSKKNIHRARLIVRNLPFAVTEDNLREHFSPYGEIDEVKLLKREDGQLLGCGFIQYKLVQAAAKAKHYVNGKPFLNRNIECDFALPKNKYQKEQTHLEEVEIKDEPTDKGYEAHEIKTESIKDEEGEIIIENSNEVEDHKDIESDVEKDDEEDSDEAVKSEEDYSEEEEFKSEVETTKCNTNLSRPKVQSNDTVEGKTIFIKNVPFSATNTDIKSCFSQFGPLYYALVCMDPLTEHSKGTAFVKFRNKEDADQCLQQTNLTLMGNVLEIQVALARNELEKKSNDKKKPKNTDSRNLYLVKEGVILAGSKAAEGVSAFDMTKRLQLEQYKTHMLRNLNMIVARTRLVVHNIPVSWDDNKLRSLFKKYSDSKAIIKEARIMQNRRILDSKGVGKSKEFGFVTFTSHEAALAALRSINNNPHIFSANKRPIVAFSIENRARLMAKDSRLQNSRLKNPKCKNYDPKAVKINPKGESTQQLTTNDEVEHQQFTGVAATPGIKKMRNKFNLKTQSKLHHEQLKKEKKNKKHAKKSIQQIRGESMKQPKQKINKNKVKENDNFSKLVNQYKKQLFGQSGSKDILKKKWFA